jgi:soluble lytic murein transglycosylase
MRRISRSIVASLALLGASQVARADPPNPVPFIHADRWPEAQAAVAGIADPVATKLVRFYRMIAPNAAHTAEIAAFIAANPDWPAQALLERRRQEALAFEADHAVAVAQCTTPKPTMTAALIRCAGELNAPDLARQAWTTGITDPAAEAAFLQRWASVLTPDDEWSRYVNLAWSSPATADRQVARLDATHKAMASNAPAVILAQAKSLRAANDTLGALALWKRQVQAAQQQAPDRQVAFWSERQFLVRALLKQGLDRDAYDLTLGHGQTGAEQVADAEFLAGFIALRRLKLPAAALTHFKAVAAASPAAITQGRAHYWLGRTLAAMGQDPKPEYEQAAAWTTTFYGQLAAVALGDGPAALSTRINDARDPVWTKDTAQAFAGHEVVRAATWLVAWGDAPRARYFLSRMDELAPDPAERALTADLAMRLGLPDAAIMIARRMGRDGLSLPRAGWPIPFHPPLPPDEATSLSIIRQESNFDVGAISPSGARGLMQLMPFTAKAVAKKLGRHVSVPTLTVDSQENMLLGTSYLQEMLDRFGGSLPLAAAAYNAGPHRVDQWLADNGDPRASGVAMTDWLELIPFSETRNYVQRVLENAVVYRARLGSDTPVLLAQWAN